MRVGALGHIRPFVASDAEDYARMTRVLCQTQRGLEVGEVLTRIESPTNEPVGTLLRALTPGDDPHLARLRLRSDSAYRSCRQWMQQLRVTAVLMDVEPLFDGNSLHFYFADQVPPRLELLRQQLSRAYQAEIQFHSIERGTATESCGGGGCGEGDCCGTESHDSADGTKARRGGCGTDGCATCSVFDICGKRKRLYGDVQATQ